MFSLIFVILTPSSQKVDMDAIEDVGVLELRPVTALIHHYETRAGNHVCDLLAFLRWIPSLKGGNPPPARPNRAATEETMVHSTFHLSAAVCLVRLTGSR
jgi:hypothetical protein